jgi:hypothetical protein
MIRMTSPDLFMVPSIPDYFFIVPLFAAAPESPDLRA